MTRATYIRVTTSHLYGKTGKKFPLSGKVQFFKIQNKPEQVPFSCENVGTNNLQ